MHICAYVYGEIRLTVDVVPRGSSCFLRQGLLLPRLSESLSLTVQEPQGSDWKSKPLQGWDYKWAACYPGFLMEVLGIETGSSTLVCCSSYCYQTL